MSLSYMSKEHQRDMRYLQDAIPVGKYGFPLLRSTHEVPQNVYSFNERKNVWYPQISWIDFFIDDSHFIIMDKLSYIEIFRKLEILQEVPEIKDFLNMLKYRDWRRLYVHLDSIIKNLRLFKGIITPDFSLYPEMSEIERIYRCKQSRIIAHYMQKCRLNIIPSISWALMEDFEWCLNGIPSDSTVAISTNGCKSEEYSKKIFLKGVEEIQKRLNPYKIVVCGLGFEELNTYDNISYYPSFSQRMRLRLEKKKLEEEKIMEENLKQLEFPFVAEAEKVSSFLAKTNNEYNILLNHTNRRK